MELQPPGRGPDREGDAAGADEEGGSGGGSRSARPARRGGGGGGERHVQSVAQGQGLALLQENFDIRNFI